jgi:hypothetical protein
VLARAAIELPGGAPLGAGRLRAIAVAGDAQRLWVTLSGAAPGFAGHDGVLIEVPAFDAAGAFVPVGAPTAVAGVAPTAARDTPLAGAAAFMREFTPADGLGPLFNARSCATCHAQPGLGGMSSSDAHFGRRIARMDAISGRVLPIDHPNSPVARRHSTRDLGVADAPAAMLPRAANVVSLRMPPALYAVARLDEIDDAAIEAQAVAKGDGIKGRVHRVSGPDGQTRIGRYGWKADIATLDAMVADAFATELGVQTPLAPRRDGADEVDGSVVRAVAAFLRNLRQPTKEAAP